MKDKYDVIVIGLGAMGSATAYQLAKRKLRVLGIDQFEPPHDKGSSHGDTRITRLAIGESESLAPLAKRSHQIWQEIEQELDETLMTLTGGLYISSENRSSDAHVEGFFERTVSTAKKLAIKHELLDAKDIRKRFPQFIVKDDERGYFEFDTGFLRPENCIKANLKLTEKHGGDILTNEKVVDFDTSSSAIVRTENHEFQCENIIITAGAWINEFVRSNSIFKTYRQLLWWFDIKENYKQFSPDVFPVFIWEPQGTPCFWYGFPAIDGVGGGLKLSTESFENTIDPGDLNRTVSQQETNFMFETYVAPFLKGVSNNCIKSAACMYTVTPDFQFVIDLHPESKNVHLVSACSGHGFKHSAAIGEAMAEKIVYGKSKVNLSGLSMARFN